MKIVKFRMSLQGHTGRNYIMRYQNILQKCAINFAHDTLKMRKEPNFSGRIKTYYDEETKDDCIELRWNLDDNKKEVSEFVIFFK